MCSSDPLNKCHRAERCTHQSAAVEVLPPVFAGAEPGDELAMLWVAGAVVCALLSLPLLRRPGLFGLLQKYKHVALVVAHPDDEAMFFWPVLSQLCAAGINISVLCLSTGNFDGLGSIRQEEMRRSCARIGVRGESLEVLDQAELQDGWREWPADIVAGKVIDFLEKRGASAVLTFDNAGVSGHPNHISTSSGAQRALELVHADAKLPQFELFLLKSVGIHEKYLGPLCLLLGRESVADAAAVSCSAPACLAALAVHWSQLVWYRVLFTLFSHYAYVNTFFRFVPGSPAKGSDADLKCAKED